MAQSREVADLIALGLSPPAGPRDISMYIGVVLAWDQSTGSNEILVDGTQLPDLRVLQSGIGMDYNVGETVVVLKKQTQYFILGRVSAPGAGAGSGIRSAGDNWIEFFGTSGAWADMPLESGPSVTAYIGASRSCLVQYRVGYAVRVGDTTFGAHIYDADCYGQVSFEVTGASNIPAGTWQGQRVLFGAEYWNTAPNQMHLHHGVATGFMHLTSAYGLNSGSNTFSMKYNTNRTLEWSEPFITVIPL